MARIHFIVKETAKIRYQDQARREGKSLGEWMREAADDKLASARPRKFTVQELREFAARCDAMHPSGTREPDWPEIKRMIAESRYPDLERLESLPRRFDPREP